MSRKQRLVRRLGAVVLLFAWAQVATANAVPCAIWCHMNGGMHHTPTVHAGHHHSGGTPQHDCQTAIGGNHCGTPQLLVTAAVAPEVPAVPAVTVSRGGPPVAALHSFVSTSLEYRTPPPRA